MEEIEREAKLILNFLYQELGLIIVPGDRIEGQGINGYEAIELMKRENYRFWKEMEWPSYYIKFLLERQSENLGFEIIRNRKWVIFKKNYIWDVRVNSSGKEDIILTDVEKLKEKFRDGNGYGLIVIEALCHDEQGTVFRDWVDELKGGKSAYTTMRERQGATPRKRKSDMQLQHANVFYWQSLQEFETGIGTWLNAEFAATMRNSNDNIRNPKYCVKLASIPRQFFVTSWNFNWDPEEFHEMADIDDGNDEDE